MTRRDALTLEGLTVDYRAGGRDQRVLDRLDLRIGEGGAYGLVGESGCGKSTAAYAAMRYLPRNGRIAAGRVLIDGEDVLSLAPAALRTLRRSRVAMVYQDPGRALNPSLRVGRQLTEQFELAGLRGDAARESALAMLERVRIAQPERVMASYPHELSGGLQQRVVIAMALSNEPALLILDEPTTGLDATVEAEILDLISNLRADTAAAIMLISHSLPVIARMCDRIGVLYAGKLVEEGTTADVMRDPCHPYTHGLLRCAPEHGRRKTEGPLETIPGFLPAPGAASAGCVYAPRCPIVRERCHTDAPPLRDLGDRASRCHFPDEVARIAPQPRTSEPGREDHVADTALIRAAHVTKTFKVTGRVLHAVRDVGFELRAGETLGLVGESGSGKSTLAKLLLGLVAPDPGGEIRLRDRPLPALAKRRDRTLLKALQMVFQNPGLALNRSHSVRRLIRRSLRLTAADAPERERRLDMIAERVRLDASRLNQTPARLSGGLKQRVGIARAFVGEPEVVVCDEPTSALDVSVQAAILNLLVDLQAERGVSYLFISHDLGVVNYIADRVAVLYVGRLLEIGPTELVLGGPHHPYTEALVSASLQLAKLGHTRIRLEGEIPSPLDLPTGCIFQARCPRKIGQVCEEREPKLTDAGNGHLIRCHIPREELARLQVPGTPLTRSR